MCVCLYVTDTVYCIKCVCIPVCFTLYVTLCAHVIIYNYITVCVCICRNVNIKGKMVRAQIWDTAGQERYRAITSV